MLFWSTVNKCWSLLLNKRNASSGDKIKDSPTLVSDRLHWGLIPFATGKKFWSLLPCAVWYLFSSLITFSTILFFSLDAWLSIASLSPQWYLPHNWVASGIVSLIPGVNEFLIVIITFAALSCFLFVFFTKPFLPIAGAPISFPLNDLLFSLFIEFLCFPACVFVRDGTSHEKSSHILPALCPARVASAWYWTVLCAFFLILLLWVGLFWDVPFLKPMMLWGWFNTLGLMAVLSWVLSVARTCWRLMSWYSPEDRWLSVGESWSWLIRFMW